MGTCKHTLRVAKIPVNILFVVFSTTTISPTGTSPSGDWSVRSSTRSSQSMRPVRDACRTQSGQFSLKCRRIPISCPRNPAGSRVLPCNAHFGAGATLPRSCGGPCLRRATRTTSLSRTLAPAHILPEQRGPVSGSDMLQEVARTLRPQDRLGLRRLDEALRLDVAAEPVLPGRAQRCARPPVEWPVRARRGPAHASEAQNRTAARTLSPASPSPASPAVRVASTPSATSRPSCQRAPARTLRLRPSPNVTPV